ncbi:beta-glucosidase [Cohnella sp. OV330]|uniref:S-layer homology domain-containing protein n=1 Tax=Cohnella sp. OV330 TaxID=1855288 RepID=UPI0008EEEA9C|nr:S-layer homology domain-containing protein [Cohnella sp. OV330]SFB05849.1 beta-glucosidase [Cohnella sp. OV330]
MNKTIVRTGKKSVSALLAGVLSAGLALGAHAPAASAAETVGAIAFKTQSGGVFDGMPLFDGNPSHLDAFVDTYYGYIGLEGAALYATGLRDNYTFVMDDAYNNGHKGKTVPGGLAAADNVYGVSTDFPALVGLGQTWNKALVSQIGEVMGSEKISQLNVKQGTANIHNGANASKPIAFTALSDVRVNPLNGRTPEGYGEDPYLSATLIDNMASGLAGTDQAASQDGFWQRAVVGTKHFSLYNAEWFRQTSSTNAGARAIYEYQIPSAFKGLESGSVAGVMTSFGRTNGVPNIISPYMILGSQLARYGMYSSPDFNGENHLFNTSFSNGFDAQYTLDRKHALALMVLAHSESVRAIGTDKTDAVTLANAVNEGLYGITLQDVEEAGRPIVNQLVRLGIFNEVDAGGVPIDYPFANQAKDVSSTLTDYSTAAHQEVALQAARESVVLLKNTDEALPLSKTKKAAVVGAYADMRMRPGYAATTPTALANAGKTPLYSILNTIGAGNVKFSTGSAVIALKSAANDKYVTAGTGAGSQLNASFAGAADALTDAQLFDYYDWGQNAASLKSKANGLWVTAPTANSTGVGNTATANLLLTNPDWTTLASTGNNSTVPAKLRFESNGGSSVSIVSGGLAIQTGLFSGRLLTTGADGAIATGASTIGTLANFNARDNSAKFDKTVVQEAGTGADIAAMANTQDYALVFVGAHPNNSGGEGSDRADLYLGADDYKIAHNVAAAFAAKNKKTIVVLLASSPVIMEEIQKDPNVSAVITQPYSGEFDAQGLTDVLFGDYAPTGRLSATWYADMSALPALDKYSIPEGSTVVTAVYQLDPRFVSDMFNADPVEAKLTYMYTDAPVTYEFGYGLSYGEFTYKEFTAPTAATANQKFNVSVELTNEGSITTSEVVQLYARKNGSAYGVEVPAKKLVAYDKVELTQGEHKIVTLSVDPKDLAIWDVNKGDYIVEDGAYTFMIGRSSKDIRATKDISISGDSLATLDAKTAFNVFDHAYDSNAVVYREASKARTVESLRDDKIAGEYYAVMSKGAGAWVALPKADFTGAKKIEANVGTNGAGGNITLRADSPTAEPFATIAVPVTGKTTYTMPTASDQTVNELGYQTVEAAVAAAPAGTHTVYVVFEAADLRIDSLQVTQTAVNIAKPVDGAALPAAKPGVAYDQTLALEASGGTAPYTWSVSGLPEGLSFDAATGKITGTVSDGAEESSPYTVTISATDANGETVSVTNTLAVGGALGIGSPEGGTVPAAKVGTAYSVQLAAYGGTEPYTWTVTGLPEGLALDGATQKISGTPAAGTDVDSPYEVIIRVTDSADISREMTVSLDVAPSDPVDPGTVELAIVTPAAGSAIVSGNEGSAYDQVLTLTATGGTEPYAWSIGGLPKGLTFDPATLRVSGTPTSSGTFPLTIAATDADGRTATVAASLTIAPIYVPPYVPPVTTPVTDPSQPDAEGKLKVTDAMLTVGDASASVTLPAGTKTAQLPASLLGKADGKSLELKAGDLSLTLPAAVLKQLAAAIPADRLGDAQVQVSFKPIEAAAAAQAVGDSTDATAVKLAGDVIEFTLTVVVGDASTAVTTFDAPLTLTLKADGVTNPKLGGIFYLAGDGTRQYVDSKYVDGAYVAQIQHFSKYAVLEVNKSFADVPASHWAIDVIKELAAKQIVGGTSETTFEPGRTITRAEFTQLLAGALKLTDEGTQSFEDVSASAWYAKPIALSAEAGIVTGRGDGTFDPSGAITRQEMATMIVKAYRYLHGTASAEGAGTTFADADRIAAWAAPYVAEASSLGLLSGRGAGQFAPQGVTTRAEAAQSVYNLLQK